MSHMEPVPNDQDPTVQPASDRLNLKRGRTVEIVFHHGNSGHYENLTPGQARALQAKLQTFLWALRVESLERDPTPVEGHDCGHRACYYCSPLEEANHG